MRTKASLLTAASRPNLDGIRLHIEYVPIDDVAVSRRSLQSHSKASIKRLAAGIDRFGFNVPLLVDEDLSLISGYARLAAARVLGLLEVPVIRIAHLTEEQLQLFRIFDNRIAEEGEWDQSALSLTFDELSLADPAIELEICGFAIGEIDAIRGAARTKEFNDLDDARQPDALSPSVSRIGDLWLCGRHRVLCGNSLDPDAIDHLANGVLFSQSVSDPPFDLPTKFISSSGAPDFTMAAGEMGPEKFTRFLRRYLTAIIPHLADGALIYAFMDHRHIVELMLAAEAAGLTYKQLLVWVKSRAGQGSFYRSGHELVGVYKYGEAPSRNNIELGRHGRNRSNVLSYPGVMGSGGRKTALAMHPTVKNVAMLADLLLDASAPGDAVIDSFGGSGSTLIAAEKTGRRAYLCEISPIYVDVTVERFNALGLGEARLAATGQTFAEVHSERLADAGKA